MAQDLTVDTDGMRIAAVGSAQTAADVLAGGTVDAAIGARPSDAGVAAVDAAAAVLRARQADRIAGQAGDVSAAGARYDDTDGSNADDISVTM